MLVAFWSIHRLAGFFVFHRPDEGYEYVTTLAVVALTLGIVGPGSLSIDSALGIDESLSGTTGAGIYAVGLLAGAGQLALLWRKPGDSETS
jgi:putative oxidoreductase